MTHNMSLGFNQTNNIPSSGGASLVGLVLTCLVLGLCFLLGLPSNLHVIYSFSSSTWGRTTRLTLLLVLNLAMSDTLSLSAVPVFVYVLVKEWPSGDWSCSLFSYLLNCCLFSSVFTVTLMSICQYQAIKSMTTNRRLQERLHGTRRRSVVLLGGLWFLSCLLATPTLFTRGVVEQSGGLLRCQRHIRVVWHKVAAILFETLAGFIVPGFILSICYFSLYKKANQTQSQNKAQKCHLNWLVSRILLCFILLWMPYHLINVLDICTTLLMDSHPGAYTAIKYFRRRVGDTVKPFSFINSCLNPFLYAYARHSQHKKKQQDSNKSTQMSEITVSSV